MVQDREAILGLAGAFAVEYRYEETVVLREGYTPALPYRAQATEVVWVAEDAGDRIVLQHLLLIGEPALVVKHWRQDWVHAPAEALQYVDNHVWQRRGFNLAELPGVWTRTVYEADGAPAYTNWGRWSHETGVSSWSSSTSVLAPLPRREAARAGDYEVVWVEDRITRTPDGWSQEQDLTKSVFVPTVPPLVRESGVVRYAAAGNPTLARAAAQAYWQEVEPYWGQARAAWAQRFARGRDVSLRSEHEGEPRWRRLFAVIDAAADVGLDPAEARKRIEAVLGDYVYRP